MDTIKTYQGIPPREIIEDEILHRRISQRAFAKQLGDHPQVLMKLDDAFGFKRGTFWILQAYYEADKFLAQAAKTSSSATIVSALQLRTEQSP